MPPSTSRRGGRYATTYDYTADKLNIHKPHIPSENRIVKALTEAALESGLSYSDAVRFAIGVYKEIDIVARDEHLNILSRTALKDIRVYCRAIMRSGTTFNAFEVATKAVAAWRMLLDELQKLHAEWDRETVTRRLKLRKIRQDAAAKIPPPVTVIPGEDETGRLDEYALPAPEDMYTGKGFGEVANLEWEVDGQYGHISEYIGAKRATEEGDGDDYA